MKPSSIDEYAASPVGAEFFTAYDALLSRWSGGRCVDVDTPWGTTRVNICGRKLGPPVVLLPGFGATSMSFTANVDALSTAGFRVIALDYPGDAGRSLARPRRCSTDDLLRWLIAVFDALDLRTTHVVAHSYGAMVALAFAIGDHRERVDRLVLLDPTSCFAGIRPNYLIHGLPTLVGRSPDRQRRFLEWETGAGGLTTSDVGRTWLRLACAGAAFPAQRPVVPRRPRGSRLATLADRRLTVILAPQSKAHNPRSIAESVATTAPDAQILTMPTGTHHSFPVDPARDVNDALVLTLAGETGQR